MPVTTGNDFVRDALRELGVLDPIEAGAGEDVADGIRVASDLLDAWRNDKLTVSGVTRNVYSLTANTQTYTIGSGGTFNQAWPAGSGIEAWSVIPDDDATDPVEVPRGRPYTSDEWQQIRVKSLTAAYPTALWWDRVWSAGLGNVRVWPIPDNGDVDLVLYCSIPAITALVAATEYNLQPGFGLALKLNLALLLAPRHNVTVSDQLRVNAADALGALRKRNVTPRESGLRPEFVIGAAARRTFNIRTGSS